MSCRVCLPVTEEIDTAMDAQLKAFSDEQLADAMAPAGTQRTR